jgi:hypothetical protein
VLNENREARWGDERESGRRREGEGDAEARGQASVGDVRLLLTPFARAADGGKARETKDNSLPLSFSLSCSAAQLEE